MNTEKTAALARTALQNCPVFQPLPANVIARLARTARFERYDKPTLIMERGKPAIDLRYVVSGYIIGKAHAPDGREAELIPYGIGQWLTWIGTFTDGPMVQEYWSSEEASYLAFPNAAVLELTDPYPEIYKVILGEVSERFRTALRWIWTANLTRNETRAARHLLLLAGDVHNSRNVISVSQDSLARTLGLSRQTMSKLLKGLEGRGLIEIGYRTLHICDVQALRSFAEEDGRVPGETPAPAD